MNMKTNYLKLNSWAVAALMGMCSLAAVSYTHLTLPTNREV